MSEELPERISDVLRDTADEARIDRLWRGIEKGRRPTRTRWLAPAAGLAVAAALVLLVWRVSFSAAPPGPLLLDNDEPIGHLASVTEFADGSRIELSDEARLELLRNDASAIDWLLHDGEARFEVEPGGTRTWTIEAGLATVEVVGTVFTVERSDDAVVVRVERGVVLVRGPTVPNRAVRLTATESITVRVAVSEAPPPEPARVRDPEPPPRQDDVVPERPSPRAPLDAEALMARADEARTLGRHDRAAVLLGRAMALRGDPAAGLAAFTLGRLELEQLERPDRAAAAFTRALSASLPPRLREDALARLAEAHARAGQSAAARRTAQRYLVAYPEGRHVAQVRAYIGGE